MHRFYLPPEQCQGLTLFLAGREAHHALHVLRIARGQRVAVLDGAGVEYLCDVQDFDRDKVRLNVAEKRCIPPLPYQITLLQALPKGKIIESIIQKATELGVFRIVPILSERVVAQLDKKESGLKAAKWQLVAIEAIKQCGSAWLPHISAPLTPEQFLAEKKSFELPLVASLQSDSKHAREYFRAFAADHGRAPKSICVWVGPVGDISPAEMKAIRSVGALPITLGSLVLRSETAAIYSVAILKYELEAELKNGG